MIPRIQTAAESFRIFYGFKRPDLAEDAFLGELGAVFMPGTPLMLRDLGLAAYLPTVVPRAEGVADLPDEVAIVAYASRERYTRARNDTITGRMYTHTHRAVFDMTTSRSQYAEPVGAVTEPVTPFWCFGDPCDWQADGDVVSWVGHAGGDAAGYPRRFLDDLTAVLPDLREGGVRECVGQVGPAWASLWLLLDGFAHDPLPGAVVRALDSSPGGSSELLRLTATRLLWLDEPPPANAARPSAWTFVFARDPRHFLR